jgi:predicted RNA methylase
LANGTSVFDPVLTEIMVRWYSTVGSTVLDPFAGGSVRGVISAMLGRRYIGIDLRAEQIAANRQQAQTILRSDHTHPIWHAGDSRNIDSIIGDEHADLILTCPPYGNLERYSDDPADLSAMTHADFSTAYRTIVRHTMGRLRPDRFAVFVVGDYRDSDGNYRNFVSETIDAVRSTGAHLYNEAVLINMTGTGAMVASSFMRSSRKLVKLHQSVLVFLRGNAKRATEYCGDLVADEVWRQHLPVTQP